MIKAIVFDCFGVLTESKWEVFQKGLDPNIRIDVRDIHRAYDRGFLGYYDFRQELIKITGMSAEDADEIFMTRTGYHKNTQLMELIRELKKSYKLGILSNVGSNWLREKLLTPDEVALFDDFVLSYEVGLGKPDPEIYRMTYDRLGVAPGEVVFVDDKAHYCQVADNLGMHGITYTNFAQFKQELDRVLADSNH